MYAHSKGQAPLVSELPLTRQPPVAAVLIAIRPHGKDDAATEPPVVGEAQVHAGHHIPVDRLAAVGVDALLTEGTHG